MSRFGPSSETQGQSIKVAEQAVCEYMSFAKSWKGKGCSSQAETWQVKNILMKDFD